MLRRTVIAVAVVPLLTFLYCLAVIALALAGAPATRIHRLYVSFSRACLRVGGTKLVVHGVERIEAGRAYVVVPNHESGWDPMCLLAGLPRLVMRFVVKQQFMHTPILGHALRLTGNIRVLRADTKGDFERIHAGMDRRDPEVSFLFFAEGTLGYGLPILPIGLAGTRHVWETGILRLRRGTVTVEVGAPIPTEQLDENDRDLLRDRTFTAVASLRTRARERLRAMGVDPGGID
jgi:1-acyl-sn-glycerol-3-phosphate acyltransferase